MNELQFAQRVRQHLDLATQLDARVAARLRAAREQALARVPARAGADVALAGPALGRLGTPGVLRVVAPLVILAIACAAVLSWQQRQRAAEIEELDAQLLASDLPIDAYLDQGFAAWLKRRALQQP
jgi:hypothetical protein